MKQIKSFILNTSKIYFCLLFICLYSLSTAFGGGYANEANNSASNNGEDSKLWRQIEESQINKIGKRNLLPAESVVFRLDRMFLKNLMSEMPPEFANRMFQKTVVMEVPLPDGKISRFRIEESDLLAPHIKADFPDWRTFNGYGIDDPEALARFDWTSKGFHGYILTPEGTIYIEPFQENDTQNYIVFHKHKYGTLPDGFSCKFDREIHGRKNYSVETPASAPYVNGAQIRQYRIAVATTGEWSRSTTGSTDPNTVRTAALAALTTAINRLDGIYRRELAVTLQLVNPSITDEAANIIFDDPATDPFNNTDSGAQLKINQTTIDTRVGAGNYDVGHLFGTGGGGIASSPVVCSPQKAEGYSARAGFLGDPFVVDYVAHELGHQFGADHTYNNADPGGAPCSTRAATSAYEVASGATIMSYVGICNDRNLQQYVDTGTPSFHIKSLTDTINYIQDTQGGGGSCGTPLAGANTIPTVNAGANYTIPRLTPFTLTATANDPDPGANLLYSWEQYDLAPSASGTNGTPAGTYDVDTDGVQRPLFRTYSPVTSPARTFPSLTFILNNQNMPPLTYTGTHPTGFPGAVCEAGITCVTGENLPSIARTMNFRVSVRDSQGGNADAGMTVTTVAGTGPFRVSSQNTATTWAANSNQTITWDVAGTNANGINAANVKISLSTDGGQTFPVTLSASTANDGSEQITVPNNATTQARIKVEAVGNIFFDINDLNFTINAAAVRSPFDFDGDSRTDVSIYRPSLGEWWYLRSSDSGNYAAQFGSSTDKPTPADFTGDGRTDIAFFRPSSGHWFVLRSEDSTFYSFPFGSSDDIPAPADYDGDGRADPAVFRPSSATWFIFRSSDNGVTIQNFGVAEDKPVVSDYDGDGKADIAIFRPSVSEWWLLRSQAGLIAYQFGSSGDKTVQGDYTGDGKADIAFWRPSSGQWFVLRSEDSSFFAFPFGQSGDTPVAGDYDGDGRMDAAVYRPSNNVWYLNGSTSGVQTVPFGITGDIPIPNVYSVP